MTEKRVLFGDKEKFRDKLAQKAYRMWINVPEKGPAKLMAYTPKGEYCIMTQDEDSRSKDYTPLSAMEEILMDWQKGHRPPVKPHLNMVLVHKVKINKRGNILLPDNAKDVYKFYVVDKGPDCKPHVKIGERVQIGAPVGSAYFPVPLWDDYCIFFDFQIICTWTEDDDKFGTLQDYVKDDVGGVVPPGPTSDPAVSGETVDSEKASASA